MKIEIPYHSTESFSSGMKFVPSPTDVIISTPAKSGTTWVLQICHGLRSGGDMSFDDISCIIPCLEFALDLNNLDLQTPQPYLPRMYKTHMSYTQCPKGAGKYIVVVRKPADAAVSMFHFRERWMFAEGEVLINDYVEWMVLGQPNPGPDPKFFVPNVYVIESWYPHRLDENVLWLHFEDLKQNLPECVRLIAEFLDIGKDDKELQKLATYEFMKMHDLLFDEHFFKLARNEVVGLPREAGTNGTAGKVRKGAINESKEKPSAELLERFDAQWKDVVMPVTGYETYDAMRAGINEELGREF